MWQPKNWETIKYSKSSFPSNFFSMQLCHPMILSFTENFTWALFKPNCLATDYWALAGKSTPSIENCQHLLSKKKYVSQKQHEIFYIGHKYINTAFMSTIYICIMYNYTFLCLLLIFSQFCMIGLKIFTAFFAQKYSAQWLNGGFKRHQTDPQPFLTTYIHNFSNKEPELAQ